VQAVDGVHQQEMVHIMKTVTRIAMAPRRQHERSFKTELVAQCLVPGASVAAIALAGGINANLLFKWRRDHLTSLQPSGSMSSPAVLVPVHVEPVVGGQGDGGAQQLGLAPVSPSLTVTTNRVARSSGVIELEIAGAQLRLRGPVDEASLCSVLRALRHST
jgi:transposase